MTYSVEYTVQYQDIDEHQCLRLYTLENYLLNAAGHAADAAGYGIDVLFAHGWTWVLIQLHLELTMLPTHGEHLRIETWVEQYAHMISVRNFRILYLSNEKDEWHLIGQAQSQWVVLDLTTRQIVNCPLLAVTAHPEADAPVRLTLPAVRVRPMATTEEEAEKITIKYSDCDYNGHCNSCKYLEKMLDAHEVNVNNSPIRLVIKYVKEVHKGEPINISFSEDSQGIQYQIKNEKNQTCCAATISKISHLTMQ